MLKLVEVAEARNIPAVNTYVARGWQVIGITETAYHLGRYEAVEDPQVDGDWRYGFVEWVDNLDPQEVDKAALEGLGFGDGVGGAEAYILAFKRMLGLEPAAPSLLGDDD